MGQAVDIRTSREGLVAGPPPDFYLGRDRAMISLGPLRGRYCAYRCPFCYVKADFPSYPRYDDGLVLDWLRQHRSDYSIVYISGDTDSFAPPRGRAGLQLIRELLDLEVDVLFTTRAFIDYRDRGAWSELAAAYQGKSRMLIGCVSISQVFHPTLEPPPIPSVARRIEMLAWMRSVGIATALTIRPFLPFLPADEYAEIARQGGPSSDVIIGGDWYVDVEGRIVRDTAAALGVDPASSGPPDASGSLYFSNDDKPGWLTYSHPAAEAAVRQAADEVRRPFFMGSEGAVAHLRSSRTTGPV